MAGCRIPHFDTLFMFGIHTHISQFPLRLSFPSIFPVPVIVPVVIALQNTVPDTPKTLCLTASNSVFDNLKHTL